MQLYWLLIIQTLLSVVRTLINHSLLIQAQLQEYFVVDHHQQINLERPFHVTGRRFKRPSNRETCKEMKGLWYNFITMLLSYKNISWGD